MSRYFAAFDAAVSAAGYNAFHELIALGVPSLYVPIHRETDDQAARARWAERAGVGRGVEGPDDPRLEARLDELLDSSRRREIADRLAALDPAKGAAEAADWLAGLATATAAVPGPQRPVLRAPRSPSSERGIAGRAHSFRRRWGQFIRYAPRTVARLTRQQLTQPRPRTLVLALGIVGAPVGPVRDALARTPDPAERVLVVTDSLELGPLRELGVGIEHVPAEGERQPELAGADYNAFLLRRLELILAERPRPRRVLIAPGSRRPPPGFAGSGAQDA
ncbi:MAG: glycosyltransferase [Solirubrobacterales bacterium]